MPYAVGNVEDKEYDAKDNVKRQVTMFFNVLLSTVLAIERFYE